MAWKLEIRNIHNASWIDVCASIQRALPPVNVFEKPPIKIPPESFAGSPRLATSRLTNLPIVECKFKSEQQCISASFFRLEDETVDLVKIEVDGLGDPLANLTALWEQLPGDYFDATLDNAITDAKYFSRMWLKIVEGFSIQSRIRLPYMLPSDSQIIETMDDLRSGGEVTLHPVLKCRRDFYLHFEYVNCLQNDTDYWYCCIRDAAGSPKYFENADSLLPHETVICSVGIEGAEDPQIMPAVVLHSFSDSPRFLAYCHWFMAERKPNLYKFSDGTRGSDS